MTRNEAQHLIDSYCDDVPRDEESVIIERLIPFNMSDFEEMNYPTTRGTEQQDQLDQLIYDLSPWLYLTHQSERFPAGSVKVS